MIRAVGGLAAVVALVAGGAGFASAGQEHRGGSIAWKPCAEAASVDCGSIRVPVDWSKPRGEKIDLAVARRKATDPRKRIGVLLINPGGPGDSGVDFAFRAEQALSPQVLERFDVIGFDPRGVGRSQPVVCSLELMLRQPALPANQREFDAFAAYNRELAADCRARSGPVFDHADTKSVVRDLDALRTALGERKINYYGISYGTLIGQQYAEEFGRDIRTMVLDSNIDHSTDTRRFNEVTAATAEDSFLEFARWCDRTTSCALHGQDVPKWWDALLARADRGEVFDHVDPSRPVSSREIIETAFFSFYVPDWAGLATWLVATSAASPVTAKAAAADEAVPNAFAAVFCQDYAIRVKDYREYAALSTRVNQIAPHMRGSALGIFATAGCIGLPEKVRNPQHRLDIDDAPKILMLNSLHDPSTSHEWALTIHRQSRDTTVLVTYEGWGHTAYQRSDCTKAVTDAYLLTLRTPRDGTRCAAVEPQFGPSVATTPRPHLPTGPRPGIPGWATQR
ncbi:pimeloyl-ACP methyl ester carboxylesterase [Actinokineospora baliensis]|uniref:alpha/beta hydrolase n=1 Tax=Actinokineospora baliensis TaxID=547056 RepID=UPI001EF7745E|nr:alpha/beta hydrolase [Actinokineospora baliensis]MBM7773886.1 pimeloyl-ACP methyl ester carboxylesterase [Actinokineospora baliensis]